MVFQSYLAGATGMAAPQLASDVSTELNSPIMEKVCKI